jgi:protein-glutamine gamma-glutamyltransferase
VNKSNSISRILGQFLFLLLPTIIVVLFILWNSNQYFSLLKEQWYWQTCYFSIGLIISFHLYQTRLRFLPSASILAFILFSVYQLIDHFAIGEFDSFFLSVQFLVFAYLFFAGWLIGWGLQRVGFFSIILSGLLIIICIYLISKTGEITISKLLQYFSPVVIFGIYQIYTHQLFRSETDFDRRFWWKFSKRFIVFISMLLLVFGGVVYFMYDEIKERVEEYGGQGKEGENQMLKNNKDGTVENKKSMGMGLSNQRNKNPEPLFCAHIDNYFPNTEIPNPLYLTSFHFTKFDTLTETFERDSTYAESDEFQPNPVAIPLFFSYRDSSRLVKSLGTKNRKTVNIEVYKKRLSASAFIAPSTAFWVQPITVEKDFQQEFKSAYRAKSYVSELNSAYFIYNTNNPQIVSFQQKRFETLRKAKGYETIDQKFYQYHTYFPAATQYQPIKYLADSLSKNKKTTIDKVLAVRDYFTARNELGEQTFKYTDNPGVPGLPSSSKLMYFLFESKKGYCAYYAGATVFILRAMKIPCRIVTGFLTVDRSDKNTGWYWFYEDQSHGWVQVYFPEYGWIDFDTTVGNDEAEQSPSPDGTPPMQPPNPVIAMSGKVLTIDTIRKFVSLQINNLIFKDHEYQSINEKAQLDLTQSNIWKDSLMVSVSQIHQGDDVMTVSYLDKLNSYAVEKNEKQLLDKMIKPLPMDEFFIKDLKNEKNIEKAQQKPIEFHSWKYYAAIILFSLLGLLIFILCIPRLFYVYLKMRIKLSKQINQQAYYTYQSSLFFLNQYGISLNGLSAYQFAKQKVDAVYGTQFVLFMNAYLKQKYSNQALNSREELTIQNFFKPFEQKIDHAFSFKQRLFNFMNLNRFINYFYLPEPEQN